MRIRTQRGSRSVAVGLAGIVLAVLAVVAGTSLSAQATGMSSMSMRGDNAGVGNTKGWINGRTATLHYTKNFFCKEPPHSKAASHCEAGANYRAKPSRHFDPLYVIVPIGFTPAKSTLQCPTAGRCIDHPHRIDLTRVFGAGTGKSLLPPHSHILTDNNNARPEWWDVKVIGVTSQRVWNKIVAHKSYGEIRNLRANHNKHVTANVPTNLFLYFSVL